MKKKKELELSFKAKNIEEVKELLADLEVLNEKYEIAFSISKDNYFSLVAELPSDETVE